VPFDPLELDVAALAHQLDERFPQVAVRHRLLALFTHPRASHPSHQRSRKQFTT
jgi:hypothetical protein